LSDPKTIDALLDEAIEEGLDVLIRASLLGQMATCRALLGVEAIRACVRYGDRYAADARSLLQDVSLLPMDGATLMGAASIGPPALRSLDALHLATALSIRDEIGAFFTYDRNLAAAAAERGLPGAVADLTRSGQPRRCG
jgi:predicted nucleic acid-binding protein